MSCNEPKFRKIQATFKQPWLERELNFLSIGGIMVLFGPTKSPEMPFEVRRFNENFGQNFDLFQKIQRILRFNKTSIYTAEFS